MKPVISGMMTGLLLLLLGLPLHAEIYKWVDEDGQVHYGERPPQAGEAQQLQVAPGNQTPRNLPSEAERREHQRRLLQAFEQERREREQQRQEQAEQQAQRTRNCAHARDQLQRYRQASSLYDYDAQGQRVTLSDEQRRQTEQRAAQQVERWCD